MELSRKEEMMLKGAMKSDSPEMKRMTVIIIIIASVIGILFILAYIQTKHFMACINGFICLILVTNLSTIRRYQGLIRKIYKK